MIARYKVAPSPADRAAATAPARVASRAALRAAAPRKAAGADSEWSEF
jgi:hypothetical protein